MGKVLLVETGNSYSDGSQNVTLYTDSDNVATLTNDDIDLAFKHDKIAGGSTIYTEKLGIGVFDNKHNGVDSINWQGGE